MPKSAPSNDDQSIPEGIDASDGCGLLDLARRLNPSMTCWSVDFAARRIHWTGSLAIHHRLPAESECGSPECLLQRVHPDDVEKVRCSLDKARDAGSYDIECRLLQDHGGVCWVHEVGQFGSKSSSPNRVAAVTLEVWGGEAAPDSTCREPSKGSLRVPIHDLRNSLGVISNVAYLIRRPGAADMGEVSNMIEEEITRCSAILSRMLAEHG